MVNPTAPPNWALTEPDWTSKSLVEIRVPVVPTIDPACRVTWFNVLLLDRMSRIPPLTTNTVALFSTPFPARAKVPPCNKLISLVTVNAAPGFNTSVAEPPPPPTLKLLTVVAAAGPDTVTLPVEGAMTVSKNRLGAKPNSQLADLSQTPEPVAVQFSVPVGVAR